MFGFDASQPVLGMVHLSPLPGSPRFDGDRDAVRERAVSDAWRLDAGGVDGIVVENFGDAPFYPDEVPRHVVASMTDLVGRVRDAVDVPVGVNVLRNDAEAALSVASATDASLVRVNVHVGARVTDQGVVEGRAHETVRLREQLGADVAILADVGVKHSAALGAERPLRARIDDVVSRGLADGVIVSGEGTGDAVDEERLHCAADACASHDVPLFVGSGVSAESIAATLSVADGVVVGTALKHGGITTNAVDEGRVREVVAAARDGQP